MISSRREFLQRGSAAGLTALSYRRVLGANDRVRVGVVGFSDRFQAAHMPAFHAVAEENNFEIVAVSDIWNRRRDEGVAKIASLMGNPVASARNNDELYARKDIDAVIISTADFQHAPHGVEAVRAGCDAYIEKPLANRMRDIVALRKAVNETRRVVQIGTQRRSSVPVIKAREYVQSGAFGEVVMARLTYNVNQPTRWRRPSLVQALRPEDTDWARFRMDRTDEPFNAHHYFEFRLYWPYSSGILDQWMVHPIDAVHFITGMPHPRSAVASGGIYQWRDGRVNPDTVSVIFDYGPLDNPAKGFQVVFSGRMDNSAEGSSDYYYSVGGALDVETGRVTGEGGLSAKNAAAAHMAASKITEQQLFTPVPRDTHVPRADPAVVAHLSNWMQCVRSRKAPVADIEAGYNHAVALCMAITALHTGRRASLDPDTQEIKVV